MCDVQEFPFDVSKYRCFIEKFCTFFPFPLKFARWSGRDGRSGSRGKLVHACGLWVRYRLICEDYDESCFRDFLIKREIKQNEAKWILV